MTRPDSAVASPTPSEANEMGMRAGSPAEDVRRVVAADRDPVTRTLATAFAGGPVPAWLVPDPVVREVVCDALAQAEFGPAVAVGTVESTADATGVAVWYPSTEHLTPSHSDTDTTALVTLFGDEVAGRVVALDAAIRTLLPVGDACLLAYLGVAPHHQRRGHGSRLLTHRHAVCDAHGVAAVLVATSRDAVRLYARHGYHVTGERDLPDGPPVWAMRRPPHTNGAGR
jgi:GNAT superfamily N-acetyltransferase